MSFDPSPSATRKPRGEMPESPEAPARILVVEDDPALRQLLTLALRREGYEARTVPTGEAGIAALKEQRYELALLDLNLPGVGGLEVLATARSLQPEIQVVVFTGSGTVGDAVEAMKRGAFDFLRKPVAIHELLATVSHALRELELHREVARLRSRVGEGTRARILGNAPAMQRMFDLLERVAPSAATVLVTGETGTGKELVARTIHDLSPRARHPFIAVNCSALPEALLESELFGHVKGSFTGATTDRRGLVEEAHGGTLFLDEIATLSPAIQTKLLRVLQERVVRRVGESRTTAVDFRLVAAGNVSLADEVAAGRFREDLFYRLNVFPIVVPPLRERKSDIPLLASFFRTRFAQTYTVEPPSIPPEVMDRMAEYGWPGNVRELEHFIERAMLLYAGSPSISFDLSAPAPSQERDVVRRAADQEWTLERLEREYISLMLERTGGNQTRAAERLGIHPRTLSRKLRQYEEEEQDGLSRPS